MLVTFGPNVSNLPDPLSKGLLDGVPDRFITLVKNLNKLLALKARQLYCFDRELRSCMFNAIERIEVAMYTAIL